MLNVKILTAASMLPPGAWVVSATVNHAALILQVACAIAACFAIFVAILRVTDGAAPGQKSRESRRAAEADSPQLLRLDF